MAMPMPYEYDTSPKKIQPDYNKESRKIKKKKINKAIDKEERKEIIKKAKIILCVLAVFLVIFTMSYRNSLINEAYSKTEALKSEYAAIEKENEQIQVSIDNSVNLNNIEQAAKELLGMARLTNKQTVYITLPKEDYIESEAEKVETNKMLNLTSVAKDDNVIITPNENSKIFLSYLFDKIKKIF